MAGVEGDIVPPPAMGVGPLGVGPVGPPPSDRAPLGEEGEIAMLGSLGLAVGMADGGGSGSTGGGMVSLHPETATGTRAPRPTSAPTATADAKSMTASGCKRDACPARGLFSPDFQEEALAAVTICLARARR